MNKRRGFIFLTFLLIFFCLTGCNKHEHTASSKLYSNEEYHYNVCVTCYGDNNLIMMNQEKHDFQEDEVLQEPTEFEEGLMKYKCSVCNYEKTESISKLDHTHIYDQKNEDQKYIKTPATCSSYGEYYYSCICGEAGEETFTIKQYGGHVYETTWTYDENYHYLKATCCDEVSQKAKHSGGTATCEKKAVCSTCGQEYGELKEHNYNQKVIDEKYICTPATCTQNAIYYFSCICGEKGTKTFEVEGLLEHTYSEEWIYDNQYHYHKALCCDNLYSEKMEHSFDVGTITVEPTTTSTGIKEYKCISCQYTKEEVLPKKGDNSYVITYDLGFKNYQTKDDLYIDFFSEYYYYLINYTDCNMNRYNIYDVEDFLVYCKTWNANGKNEMAGLGDAFGSYYLVYDHSGNGSFESQSDKGFIGYCYQNNKYIDFLRFLEVFFAYWRTDEGYTNESNHGNDFFYSAWAAFVDTCKYFFFTSETLTDKYFWFTYERSPRVHYMLDNTPDVNNINLQSTAKLGETVTLPNIERVGYDFLGWYNDQGEKVTTVSNKATVHAKWARKTYLVTFKNGSEIIDSYTVEYGLRIEDIPEVSYEGYLFTGWKKAEFEEHDFLNGIYEDITLYATWNKTSSNKGTVRINAYNTQDPTDGFAIYEGIELFDSKTTPGSSLYWYKIGINKTNNQYIVTSVVDSGSSKPTGYDYLILCYLSESTGAYTSLKALNVKVGDVVEFSKSPENLSNGSVKVNVTFKEISDPIHNIILVDDKNSSTKYLPVIKESETLTLPTLYKPGYNFIGWYLDKEYTSSMITTLSNIKEDLTLYAKWEEKDFSSPLEYVSDIVTSDTIDELPSFFNDEKVTWTSSNSNLYTIKNGMGYTNKKYQLHIKQYVTVTATINGVEYSKQITINPVLFEEMTNPMAAYVAVGSLSNYLRNNQRYLSDGSVFSEKFRENADMVYYAFGIPQSNGTVSLNTTYLDYLLDLKNDGVRVLLVIDGANKAPLQAMVKLCNDDTTRKTFVDNIVNLIKTYNFDGVDIDWEYPGTSGLSGFTTEIDQINLNKLLRDLRHSLDSYQEEGGSPYIISAAIPGTSWGSIRYKFVGDSNLGGINDYCDYVNMMSYDLNNSEYTTHVSSCYSSTMSHDYKFGCVYGANRFISLGLDPEKVILGSAGYGKAYRITNAGTSSTVPALNVAGTLTQISGVTGSFASGTIYYSGIVELMKTGRYKQYTEYNNGKIVGSYLYSSADNIFITFDSKEALIEKCNYAKANGFGMMVWAYGEDSTDTVVDTIADNLK